MVVARPATAIMACDRSQLLTLAHPAPRGRHSLLVRHARNREAGEHTRCVARAGGVLDLMVSDRSRFVRTHEAPTDQESSTAVYRGPRRKRRAPRHRQLLSDALYGLGFLHAVDRPTQMLFGHAVASGRSAERIADKPELLEADRFFRRAGLYLTLEQEVQRLDDDTFGNSPPIAKGSTTA